MNYADVSDMFKGSLLLGVQADVLERGEDGRVVAKSSGETIIKANMGVVFLISKEQNERYVLNNREDETELVGCERLWILPHAGDSRLALEVASDGEIQVHCGAEEISVRVKAGECAITVHASRPRADVMGNAFSFRIPDGELMEQTLAEFYWGTMLPSVMERTRAKDYPMWRGYVVSTLQFTKYAGTYPDVDHEFQCKGRLAMAGEFEVEVVQRMLEMQFRLMREDPAGLWRNPCAVQPDGTREYHVRRNSMDGTTNADMFLVTGNVEALETAWRLIAETKDVAWLAEHIEELEGAASLLEHLTDAHGRLWSDVFYEDQVMKDGAECMSQAMAANGLKLLSELEALLGREEMVEKYFALSKRLGEALVRPVPMGFWDAENRRFVDWLDRNGDVHDHIHLLANVLPVVFGYASPEQAQAVRELVEENLSELQRFPTFLSPKIQDYTDSEIGDGGPYDLCAAGRYWCWDAAYWATLGSADMLLEQLTKVATQARADEYKMGERYDMNYLFYIDDKNWHGAAHYYEYPCVFSWVLIREYLGISADIGAVDAVVHPRFKGFGSVRIDSYGLFYDCQPNAFVLTNLSKREQTFRLELWHMYPGQTLPLTVCLEPGASHRVEIIEV